MNTILDNIFNLAWISLTTYLLVRLFVNQHSLYSLVMDDDTTLFSDEHIFIRTIRFSDLFFNIFGLSVVATVLLVVFGMQLTVPIVFSIVANSIVISFVAAESMNSRLMDETKYIENKTGLFVKYY